MKKVSIIVAVYNVEKYLEKCLDSLIQQSYKNVEIIIVNDGSIDESEIIAKRFASKSNVILVNKENGGLSDARNAGLKVARGDYIFFVDGDDWVEQSCLENCSKYMEKDIDIIIFSFLREYGDRTKKVKLFDSSFVEFEGDSKKELERRLVGPIDGELRQAHKMEDLNPVWNKLYKRSLIGDSVFVDTKEIGTEDLWFNLPIFSKAEKIVYIDMEGYHYNKMNDNSLTRVYNKKLFARWKKLYQLIGDYIGKYSDEVYTKALINRKVINLIALTRNIVDSDLKKEDKIKELDILLNDSLYNKAFEKFQFDDLSTIWKIFYFLCKNKKSRLVYYFMKIAEAAKKWI